MNASRRRSLLAIIGPGILVAATGVGAGDLATGAFTGRELGTAILWAVLVGAGFKYVLSEGLTRWQLVTGDTILEGACTHLGPVVRYGFLAFLLVWSFGVGTALMSACGVAAHAILPLFDPVTDKVVYGIAHSLVAVALVWIGGYRLFEVVMSVCIGVMFVTVVTTAIAVGPAWGEVLTGLVWPTIPRMDGNGIEWTVALLGGVGGTLTIICYGYWIREENRTSPDDLGICRIDLATGYGMTALFGLGVIVIGAVSRPETKSNGAELIVDLAAHLNDSLGAFGPYAKWAFLAGAWGAFFSSLLGVWQCVPYLFADYCAFTIGARAKPVDDLPIDALDRAVDTRSLPYRAYLVGLATLPMLGLVFEFKQVQMWNAILGALFIPLLAAVLLLLNGPRKWLADRRNGPVTTLLLVASLALFGYLLYRKVESTFFPKPLAWTSARSHVSVVRIFNPHEPPDVRFDRG